MTERTKKRSSKKRFSKTRSSKTGSSSSIGSRPPSLVRGPQLIPITKEEAIKILKYRVKKSQRNPPKNWLKWNESNSDLFKKGASITVKEYNKIFGKNYDLSFLN